MLQPLQGRADRGRAHPQAPGQGPLGDYVRAAEPARLAGIAERVRAAYLAGRPDGPRAMAAVAEGRADMVAFGKPFISNPDLPIRLLLGAPLETANHDTFYGGGEEGYTDYQLLRSVKPDVCYRAHEHAWG